MSSSGPKQESTAGQLEKVAEGEDALADLERAIAQMDEEIAREEHNKKFYNELQCLKERYGALNNVKGTFELSLGYYRDETKKILGIKRRMIGENNVITAFGMKFMKGDHLKDEETEANYILTKEAIMKDYLLLRMYRAAIVQGPDAAVPVKAPVKMPVKKQ